MLQTQTPPKLRNSPSPKKSYRSKKISTSPKGKDPLPLEETEFFFCSNTTPSPSISKEIEEPITYKKKTTTTAGKKRKRKGGAWDTRPIEEIFGDSDDDDDLDFESLANRDLFQVDYSTTSKNKRRRRVSSEVTKPQKSKPKSKKTPAKSTKKSLPTEKSMEKIRSHFEMVDQFDLSEETQTKEEETPKPSDDTEALNFLPLDKEAATSYREYQELTRKSGNKPLSMTRLSTNNDSNGGDGVENVVFKAKSPAELKRAKEEEERIKNYYQEIDNFSLAEE